MAGMSTPPSLWRRGYAGPSSPAHHPVAGILRGLASLSGVRVGGAASALSTTRKRACVCVRGALHGRCTHTPTATRLLAWSWRRTIGTRLSPLCGVPVSLKRDGEPNPHRTTLASTNTLRRGAIMNVLPT